MRPIFWIVGVPLLLVGAFFAVANREFVTVDLWPIAGKVTMPLFVALVGALYVGFLVGAAIAWWAGRSHRKGGREARRQLAELASENARLQQRLDQNRPAGDPSAANRALPPA